MSRQGILLMITGVSGSGKDSILREVYKQISGLTRLVTYTTRKPRPEEKDGVDYYFVSDEKFKEMESNGEFFETVQYGSTMKGSTKKSFEEVIEGGRKAVVIDMSRVATVENNIRERFGSEEAKLILARLVKVLVWVEAEDALVRLKARDGEGFDEMEFEKRLDGDMEAWENHRDSFTHVVNNLDGELEKTVSEVVRLVEERLS